MRATHLLISAGMAFSVMTAPANAAWHSYISHQLGFSFEAPGEVKTTVGTYRGSAAGPKQTIVYRSVDDNIEYKVTVIPSFRPAQAGSSTRSHSCSAAPSPTQPSFRSRK